MDKTKLGTKRLCASCAARFYDLNHDPITCPMCQAIFVVPVPPPSRPPRFPRAASQYPASSVEAVAVDDEETSEEKDDEETSDVLLLDDEDDADEVKPEAVDARDPERRDRDI